MSKLLNTRNLVGQLKDNLASVNLTPQAFYSDFPPELQQGAWNWTKKYVLDGHSLPAFNPEFGKPLAFLNADYSVNDTPVSVFMKRLVTGFYGAMSLDFWNDYNNDNT